jgi:sulfopropanediol 3-dehydrogenase
MLESITYLKKANQVATKALEPPTKIVQKMLNDINEGGEAEALRYAAELDGMSGNPFVTKQEIQEAESKLPETIKDDIRFAVNRVCAFAKCQRDAMSEFEAEIHDGLTVGQKLVPVDTVGCYVPGGRYAHIASAVMTVCTAKTAGVKRIIATTPNGSKQPIHPGIIYALDQAGAGAILGLGGVVGIASLAYGLFTGHGADVIVGPGNSYVAEAKRILYGQVGIDVVAGPTETMVIADESADPLIVASDLAGQAEHGADSPVWLITTNKDLGEKVIELMPQIIKLLPGISNTSAEAAWRDHGEVILAKDREEAARISDIYASEHLHVQASDLDWWLNRLKNYGSLFLGEETTVAFGDKCAGPNHVLPTRRGARYSGGLNVGHFIKTLTYQKMSKAGTANFAPVTARLSRYEGMEGHAMTADVRLDKYFPERNFALGEQVSRPSILRSS